MILCVDDKIHNKNKKYSDFLGVMEPDYFMERHQEYELFGSLEKLKVVNIQLLDGWKYQSSDINKYGDQV